jgi:murein endopeptidase
MNTQHSPHQINSEIDATLSMTLQRLTHLLKENEKSHMMDAYPSQFVTVIEDEIIPAIDAIVNYDPTPDTPYDFFH